MDAIKLLKVDHKTVRELLDELAETTPRALKKRAELLGDPTGAKASQPKRQDAA